MSYIDDLGQKIKGKVQQVEGDLNQKRGKGVKGGIQKLKGKLNITAANIKMKAKNKRGGRW